MSFLPIVERELRVRSRLKNTYRFRVAGALLAALVVVFMLVVSGGMTSPDKFGKTIFQILGWLAFIYCLLEGARNTADCLSEEKRGGTLGLLFLTDLKGYDVVLGKLMATSLNSFYALLAVLPLLATPLLLGGVTPGEFWRLALVLVNTLFFSLTAGLFVSAISRDESRAWGASYGLVALLTLYPVLAAWWHFLPGAPLIYLSPSLAFGCLSDGQYRLNSGMFWSSVRWSHAISWAFLVLASFLLPRAWQERVTAKSGSAWQPVQWIWTKSLGRRISKEEELAENPVSWLAGRNSTQQVYLWICISAAVIGGLTSYAAHPFPPRVAPVLFWCAFGLHILLSIWVAVQASFVFGQARHSGALELLMATPITVKQIVEGHFVALRNFFFRPVGVLVFAELGVITATFLHSGSANIKPVGGLILTASVAFVILVFILDLYAAGWFGLYMGLSSRKPSQALTKTILFVIALPLICGSPCNILWPLLAMVKDVIFINYARDQMNRRFRMIVSEQYALRSDSDPWVIASPNPAPPKMPPVIPRGSAI